MNKNILTIGLIIAIVIGLGCVETPSKSGTEKEKGIINPVTTKTIVPIETTITPVSSPMPTVLSKNLGSIANKTMAMGENWNVGGGWTLTINAIDPKTAPRQVWFTLYKDGSMVDNTIINMGETYSYNISNRYFSAKVDSIFAGNKTDLVRFKDITYQI